MKGRTRKLENPGSCKIHLTGPKFIVSMGIESSQELSIFNPDRARARTCECSLDSSDLSLLR